MYKDKDKQREANRLAAKEYRERHRKAVEGMTQGMTNEGMTAANEQTHVIPKRSYIGAVPEVPGVTVLGPKRGKDINMKPFEKIWARNLKSIEALNDKPKPQSHNPMMVGYVPPKN